MTVLALFVCWIGCLIMANNSGAEASGATAKKTSKKARADKPRTGWLVQCTDAGTGLRCKATQSLMLAKTKQHLLTVTVQRDTSNKLSILYRAPLGLFLPAGIKVKFDEKKPKLFPFQTCDSKGCYAASVLAADELSRMRKGKVLEVAFSNLKRKQIALKLRLDGFDYAYNKIK